MIPPDFIFAIRIALLFFVIFRRETSFFIGTSSRKQHFFREAGRKCPAENLVDF